MGEVKKTINSIFMVPTLKIQREALYDNGFLNAYAKDEMRDGIEHEDAIHLLFHPKDMDKFGEFLNNEYDRTKDVIEDYDYPGGFVVVVYKLNPKFKTDFDIVKKGRYSKTSADFQEQFPKVVKIMVNGLHRDEISLQIRVFKKTADLRKFWEDKFDVEFDEDQEVWDGYEEEKEILTKEKLMQYVE